MTEPQARTPASQAGTPTTQPAATPPPPTLRPRTVVAAWQAAGTALFEDSVRKLGPNGLDAASALPDWTRAHVVTHVARNADALVNLLSWARTGVETPMYASPEARNRDIEAGAGRPADVLIDDLIAANERYAGAVSALPETAWSSPIRTAQGRTVPAENVLWMRVREVWVHSADLDCGVGFEALPDDVATALLDDAVATIGAREQMAPLRLEQVGGRRWEISGEGTVTTVRGSLPALLGYLLRGLIDPTLQAGSDGPVPPAPRWL